MNPRPFVKWAGGKTQLLPQLKACIPDSFNRYLEPFVGGGAMFFSLNHSNALINDSNEELMNAYIVIRDSPEDLIDDLRKHKNEKSYFYEIRKAKTSELSLVERASRLIYLNRTCYNGLWRVNKRNEFNTPYGSYKNPRIVNAELIRAVSSYLKSTEISCTDYRDFLQENARETDFVYMDPPYDPISKYSDFKRYTRDFFGKQQQTELADVFRELDQRGCLLMLSNSSSSLVRDLYSEYNITQVKARRSINKNGDGRAAIDEVLVRNYG